MKFGLMFSFVVPPDGSATTADVYREMDDILPMAEDLGYTSFHTTEHHFQDNGWAPSPLMVLAKAAGLTSQMRLATNILIIPLYHPLRLAEDIATLDNLCAGRLDLGVSPGYVSEEMVAYEVVPSERVARFEEALDLMEVALQGDEFTWSGKHYSVPKAKVVPRLAQEKLPIWYGVSGPKMLRRAAVRGVPVTASPRHTVDELREHFERYDRIASEVGYTPEARPIIREVFLAPSRAEAESLSAEAVTHLFGLYGRKSAQGERELRNDAGRVVTDEGDLDFRQFRSRYIIGDPETAVAELRSLQSALNPTDVICRMQFPGVSAEHHKRSVRIFAEEVMPHFD